MFPELRSHVRGMTQRARSLGSRRWARGVGNTPTVGFRATPTRARNLNRTAGSMLAKRFKGMSCIGLTAIAISCSAGGGGNAREHANAESQPGSGGDAPVMFESDAGSPICDETCLATMPPAPTCGDGALTPDEACDDGNNVDDDGCSANCLVVGAGYSCNPAGEPCHKIARCGDGVLAATELCDDGNIADGDGCSSRCQYEIGYKCDGEPSVCSHTTCGDGVKEGAESCDDGNALPFDGCSAECQTEPNCSGSSCTSDCGDGLIIDEECDDGNTKDGDGCSSTCTIEGGFQCAAAAGECEQVNGQCVLRVPVVFRDFNADHSDFAVDCSQMITGIVETSLNADGKPVLTPGMEGNQTCIASAQSFAEWYTDGSNRATIPGSIVLFDNGNGGFVNRWGPNGEQWAGQPSYTGLRYCGPGGGNCANCSPPLAAGEQCWDPCVPWGTGNLQECAGTMTQMLYDGNPLFFPIDNNPNALDDTRYEAKIADVYGWPWSWEKDVIPGAGLHNFHFTTEVHYWFKYDASKSALLEFTGDDDVWVFLNGILAVDLGGLHIPEDGSVTVNASTAAQYGLVDGQVYEISVFHAERKVEGSSFRLTLQDFSTARSICTPVCGDGVVSQGEQCDDGVNDGGYGECDVGCVLGPYCGDGIVQAEEDCDDGNRIDGDACGSACRYLVIR